MKLVLHILLKDLRRLWVPSLVAVGFILLDTLRTYWNPWDPMRFGLLSAVTQAGPVLAGFVLSIALIQTDLMAGDRGFWRTRPIPPLSLLASKLLFIVLVLVAPAVAAGGFLSLALRAPAMLAAAIAVEASLKALVTALSAAVIASVSRTVLQALAVLFAVALGVVILTIELTSLADRWGFTVPWDSSLANTGPRIAAFGLYLAAALAASLSLQVFGKRVFRTLLFAVLAVPLTMELGLRFPLAMGPATPAQAAPAFEPSPGVQVMMLPPIEAGGARTVRNPATRRDVDARSVSMEVAARDVPPGRIVQLVSIQSTLRLPDGRTATMQGNSRQYWPQWTLATDREAICRGLGLGKPPERSSLDENPYRIDLFTMGLGEAAPFEGRPSHYTGVMTFEETAYRVEARMPAMAGSSAVRPGQEWRIDWVTFSGRSAIVASRFLFVSSVLVPGAPDGPWGDYRRPHGFVLQNRARGEYSLAHDTWGAWESASTPLMSVTRFARFTEVYRSDGARVRVPVDGAWMANAELCVLEAATVGTFTKKVELDGFVLPNLEGDRAAQAPAFWQ